MNLFQPLFYFLGIADDFGTPELANDGKPYTTLLYANGPGGINSGVRENLTDVDTGNIKVALCKVLINRGVSTIHKNYSCAIAFPHVNIDLSFLCMDQFKIKVYRE